LKRLLLAALALSLAAGAVCAELSFSKHSRQRMAQRGVAEETVRELVDKGEAIAYVDDGKRKTGYYDAKRRIFIATADGVVITVITNVKRSYVEKLKNGK
jgi:hypothetical protein